MGTESSMPRILIGYTSVFGSMITDMLSTSCTQALQGAVPDFQLAVVRSTVQAISFIISGKLVGSNLNVSKQNIPGLVYLTFAYVAFNVGNYGATTYLPLIELRGVLDVARLATTFIQSRVFFNVAIPKFKILALFVCVLGSVLIAQPSWLFDGISVVSSDVPPVFLNGSLETHGMNNSNQHAHDINDNHVMLGYTLSVIAGIGIGSMYNINGVILQNVKPIVKATYAAIFSAIASVVLMFYLEEFAITINLTQSMFVLGHGALSTVTTFLFTQAAQCIPAPSVSVAYSFQIVLMLISQYTIMHSIMPGNHNWIEVLGCVIIILGGSLSSLVDVLAYRAGTNDISK